MKEFGEVLIFLLSLIWGCDYLHGVRCLKYIFQERWSGEGAQMCLAVKVAPTVPTAAFMVFNIQYMRVTRIVALGSIMKKNRFCKNKPL